MSEKEPDANKKKALSSMIGETSLQCTFFINESRHNCFALIVMIVFALILIFNFKVMSCIVFPLKAFLLLSIPAYSFNAVT